MNGSAQECIAGSMKKLQHILTDRYFEGTVSNDLVYEWEDQLSQSLGVSFLKNWSHSQNKYIRRIPGLSNFITKGQLTLSFVMNANFGRFYQWKNTNDIIPVIIDFFLKKEDLPRFKNNFKHCPLVLISSKEAYDFLIDNHIDLPIHHWALSIADKYKISKDTRFDKKYDLVMMGRQNDVLSDFVKKYAETHPDFTYVYRVIKGEPGHRSFFYYTSDGENLGDIVGRDQYIALMRQSRCGLYATPGIDTDGTRTNGFNQVTPRFLEYIASGCHILARYPKNSDTEYFELDRFCHSINSYEEFESRMDYCRSHNVDMDTYSKYLEKHYTSARAKELTEILNNIK